jgi:hypothetical protein
MTTENQTMPPGYWERRAREQIQAQKARESAEETADRPQTGQELLEALPAAAQVEIRYDDSSEEGTASPLSESKRWITCPHPTTIERFAVGVHEVCHHTAPRDHDMATHWREIAVDRQVVRTLRANEVPDAIVREVEWHLGKRLHGCLTRALADGKATLTGIDAAVGPHIELLPYRDRLVEPPSAPEGMDAADQVRFAGRLHDWTWRR